MTIYVEYDHEGKPVAFYMTEKDARTFFKLGNTLKTNYMTIDKPTITALAKRIAEGSI